MIAEARAGHMRRIVEIAAVEYHGSAQGGLDVVEVRTAELLPLGDDGQRVGALHGLRAGLAEDQIVAVAVNPPAFWHCDRLISADVGAPRPNSFHEPAAPRLIP